MKIIGVVLGKVNNRCTVILRKLKYYPLFSLKKEKIVKQQWREGFAYLP
jgi:hypothetical protein